MTTGKFRAIINADCFLRAMCCVGDDETRYYLKGIQIEPCEAGGVLLVSTDGHRMIVIRDPDGLVDGGTAIISVGGNFRGSLNRLAADPAMKLIVSGDRLALAKHKPVMFCQNFGDRMAGITPSELDKWSMLALADAPNDHTLMLQWGDSIIDGVYPYWRKCIPNTLTPNYKIGDFNHALLGPIAKALSANNVHLVTILSSGDVGAPHVVLCCAGMTAGFGIIMPMRGDFPTELPEWFAPKADATETEEAK